MEIAHLAHKTKKFSSFHWIRAVVCCLSVPAQPIDFTSEWCRKLLNHFSRLFDSFTDRQKIETNLHDSTWIMIFFPMNNLIKTFSNLLRTTCAEYIMRHVFGLKRRVNVTLFFSNTHTPTLTLGGPFVWFQHQVLFGLFQFFLQTLVLGSDLTDPLLTVLQQTKLGTDIHHLLTKKDTHGGDRQTDTNSVHLYLSSIVCCETHAVLLRQQPQHSHGYIHSHLIDSQCVKSVRYFRTLSSFTRAVGG